MAWTEDPPGSGNWVETGTATTYKPNANDPYDPKYGDPTQRVNLLGGAGFQWESGSGPNAIWKTPWGSRTTEEQALSQVLTSGAKPPVTGAAGDTYAERYALATAQRSSYNVSQSIADPAALAIQRSQLAESIRQNLATEAREQQLLSFNQDKFRVESERGDKQLALQTQQVIEAQQSRIQSNAIARQQMQQQLVLADKNIAAQQQESAASRDAQAREGVASRNLQREGMAAQDRRSQAELGLQRDKAIAEYAREPGDVGVVSAMLQRGGGSNLSTAIGNGESAITDRSLEPLAALMAPAPASPQYPMEPMPGPLTSAINGNMSQAQAWGEQMSREINAGTRPNPAVAAATPTGPSFDPNTLGATERAYYDAQTPKLAEGGAVVEPGILNHLMALVQALGLEPKAIAGERGEASGETVYAPQDANVVVVPDKGKGGQAKPKLAEGGGLLNPLLQQAREFMTRTGQTTLDRSGFGSAPTPISLADPGTNAFTRKLGAATSATVMGYPQEAFLSELMKLIPQAQTMGYGGRTR